MVLPETNTGEASMRSEKSRRTGKTLGGTSEVGIMLMYNCLEFDQHFSSKSADAQRIHEKGTTGFRPLGERASTCEYEWYNSGESLLEDMGLRLLLGIY